MNNFEYAPVNRFILVILAAVKLGWYRESNGLRNYHTVTFIVNFIQTLEAAFLRCSSK